MNIIISCLPGERRLQSVFVPPFLGSTRAMYHANSTEYLFEALTQTYTYNKRHAGRKQRTLRVPWSPDQDRLRCRGIYLGFSLEYNSENKTQYQEAPNRIQQAAGLGDGGSLLERSWLLCTYCDCLFMLVRPMYNGCLERKNW